VTPNLTVGFGAYTPFGLTTEWNDPDTFTGRFISTKVSLTPFYFNPVVGYQIHDQVRIAAGLMAVHASVELNRAVGLANPTTGPPATLDPGSVSLSASNDLDYGFNGGIQIEHENVKLGFNYRSKVTADMDGTADFVFTGTGTPLDPQLEALFPQTQGASTALSFPASWVAGLGYQVSPTWFVEGDVGWMGWSAFQSLTVSFAQDSDLDFTRHEDWTDSWFFRAGARWAVQPDTEIRFGGYYDETPQPTSSVSVLLPDAERFGLTLGAGKTWGKWNLDAFGLLLIIPDRSTELSSIDGYNGTYASSVGALGVTAGFRY
jgi:long-chain fatty acid transport protein